MKTQLFATLTVVCCVGLAQAEIREMVCSLSGRQEVPANASPAFGCGRFVIDTDRNTMTYRIVRSPLSAAETVMHIHGAADPGVNAGVLFNLPAGDIKTGVITFTEAQQVDLLAGKWYVNIHSAAFPGGEIRGQICDLAAELDSAQEVPANATTSRGLGIFNLNTTTNQLRYYIKLDGVVGETMAHIHGFSNIGTNSGVVHALPLGNVKTGVWNYPEAAEAGILSGLTYINVHTAAFPGGQIRGQVTCSVNPIDRNQEVPPSNTSSMGCAFCTLDRSNDVYGYDIRYLSLGAPETVAHIHGYSAPGVNSGVKFGLAVGARKLGVWNYPAADEAQIEAGLTYINIHTAAFPGGEVRGQVNFCAIPPACSWQADGCYADFNNDGGIDGDDVIAFFAEWDGNRPCADVNNDGGVDGDDVIAFFSAWDASGVGFPGC